MRNDTKEDERRIPPRLISFINTPEYLNFLQCLLEYCKELFRLESKQQDLEAEARQRGLDVPQVLPSEKKKLNEKATKMAYAYSWIIFKNKSITRKQMNNCSSFISFKSKIMANGLADQNFYDTLVIFSSQVLKDAFDP